MVPNGSGLKRELRRRLHYFGLLWISFFFVVQLVINTSTQQALDRRVAALVVLITSATTCQDVVDLLYNLLTQQVEVMEIAL